jgi:hypothetical protein
MDLEDKSLDAELQFARHNFDNHQSLIRFSDAKAGATLTVMVFLAASALQLSKEAVAKLRVDSLSVATLSVVFAVAALGLLFSVLWSFVAVYRVLRPRGARYTKAEKGKDLMWQDHVLLHENGESYFCAVRAAPPELILRNLTDQVYELAHISKEKMDALSRGGWAIWVGLCSWVLLILSGLCLERS